MSEYMEEGGSGVTFGDLLRQKRQEMEGDN
jgi:hypothetical protein